MDENRHTYNPMKPVALGIKLTDDEERLFQEVQKEHPVIKRAALGEVLVVLGMIEYWKRHAQGGKIDPQKFLAEAIAAFNKTKQDQKK